MSWTRPEDLRAQLRKLWERGELLRHFVTCEPGFPLRLALKGPSSTEMAERFSAVRAWIAELQGLPRTQLEMREFSHRTLGPNALPAAIRVASVDDALALIGRQRDAGRFRRLLDTVRVRQPRLVVWVAKRPLRALELAEAWDRLLDAAAWVLEHPRPGIYLRQVDIPGVHSKFIEAHRGVLAEWLDLLLPPEAIDTRFTGVAQFGARYGFRDKPARIRFRVLDEALIAVAGVRQPDISLDGASFAALDLQVRRVIVTENETNFLALPPLPESLALFGAGYGFEALAHVRWLQRCELHYWGDIDTHGFAILDQLRGRFAQVESLLMDRETLLAHEALWGREDTPARHDLPRLTAAERALYDDLRDNRIRPHLRLEQEMIGYGWVAAALDRIGS